MEPRSTVKTSPPLEAALGAGFDGEIHIVLGDGEGAIGDVAIGAIEAAQNALGDHDVEAAEHPLRILKLVVGVGARLVIGREALERQQQVARARRIVYTKPQAKLEALVEDGPDIAGLAVVGEGVVGGIGDAIVAVRVRAVADHGGLRGVERVWINDAGADILAIVAGIDHGRDIADKVTAALLVGQACRDLCAGGKGLVRGQQAGEGQQQPG